MSAHLCSCTCDEVRTAFSKRKVRLALTPVYRFPGGKDCAYGRGKCSRSGMTCSGQNSGNPTEFGTVMRCATVHVTQAYEPKLKLGHSPHHQCWALWPVGLGWPRCRRISRSFRCDKPEKRLFGIEAPPRSVLRFSFLFSAPSIRRTMKRSHVRNDPTVRDWSRGRRIDDVVVPVVFRKGQ